ncbi:hypothetical protein PAMC26577_07040 [Caballeronia sordidicola]|uniref:Uncharacterized protein n=1 Tax=Caballeronia sordidicola TaxID=196367 RepID=A0A242N2G3_CABSO|nr:hypothetical protein PAMC26577_07040 [Caballeronia sordidicola]
MASARLQPDANAIFALAGHALNQLKMLSISGKLKGDVD